jgi:hypothetical protein
MSLRVTVLLLASVSLATAVRAQGKPLPQLSLSHGAPPLTVRTYVFAQPVTPTGDAMKSGLRCPMPVFRTPSAKEDPMPVAAGGSTEPMPVARSGCWNPLFPE